MKSDYQTLLKQLGKQAKQAAENAAVAKKQAAREAEEMPDFAKLMADVKPLKADNRIETYRDRSPIKPRAKQAEILGDEDYFYIGSGEWDTPPTSFSKNGQGHQDIKRLQAGHWPVVADVDLHGYTQEQAQEVLSEFLVFLSKRGVCGEIVHGSGLGSSGYRPILKNTVRRWLMQHPDVLAYAEPHKGNDGAVRILIKRPKISESF